MEDKKLFIVEFGQPVMPNIMNWNGSTVKPVYVVARDYNEAAGKAMIYLESKMRNEPKSVIGMDGSLNLQVDEKIEIVAVKLAATEILW